MGWVHKSEDALRNEIVEICRRLHQSGYIAASDGNVSARLGNQHLLTTPSGAHKGYLRPEDIVKTDLEGQPVGRGRPSSELRMHLLVYRHRQDVQAAVHAHPVHAVALSLAGVSLAGCLLPETILSLGNVPTAPYATPTTEEVPESVRPLIGGSNAIILARHGTLTLGSDLQQAFYRLEALEHTARITVLARSIGPVEPLSPAQMARLDELARQLGITPAPERNCTACGSCRSPRSPAGAAGAGNAGGITSDTDALLEALVDRVVQRLGGGKQR